MRTDKLKRVAAARKGWETRRAKLKDKISYKFGLGKELFNCGIQMVGSITEYGDPKKPYGEYIDGIEVHFFRDYKRLNEAIRQKVGKTPTVFYTTKLKYKKHIAGLKSVGWKEMGTFQGNHGKYQMVLMVSEGQKGSGFGW